MMVSKNVSRGVLLACSVFGLVGCAVTEPYSAPQANLPAGFTEAGGGSVGEVANRQWWAAFHDNRLNSLVARANAQNLSIKIAGERFRASAAAARRAGVAVTGDIDGAAGVRGGSDVEEETFATATVQVSWLLDFFGRLSGQRAVATAELEAAGYGVEEARLAMLSELAATYIDARFAQNSLALTRRTLGSRQETLSLTQRLVDASAATVVDLTRARGLVDETRADIPALEAQFRVAANRIATLLGTPAGTVTAELSRGAAQPVPRNLYRSGVPADLLRNRPDVRVAERNLAAAVARIGVARSDLYPSISLTGRITGTARSENADGSTWSFGPTINLPIFGRGALEATVSEREANAREAWLAWQQSVLVAVEEVENGLVNLNRSRQVVAAERRATATLEEALSLAQQSYSSGERSVLDVLDAERRVGDARIRYAAAQRDYARAFVALNVAIGAGRGTGPVVESAETADGS